MEKPYAARHAHLFEKENDFSAPGEWMDRKNVLHRSR
jgi:hypothetical protein